LLSLRCCAAQHLGLGALYFLNQYAAPPVNRFFRPPKSQWGRREASPSRRSTRILLIGVE